MSSIFRRYPIFSKSIDLINDIENSCVILNRFISFLSHFWFFHLPSWNIGHFFLNLINRISMLFFILLLFFYSQIFLLISFDFFLECFVYFVQWLLHLFMGKNMLFRDKMMKIVNFIESFELSNWSFLYNSFQSFR